MERPLIMRLNMEHEMKKLWARISIEMYVTDEEYEEVKEKVRKDDRISDDLAKRFIKEGTLSEDSYIPENIFDGRKEKKE